MAKRAAVTLVSFIVCRPPNLIKRILDGVLLLRMQPMMPVQPDPDFDDGRLLPSWAQSKLMLGQFTFLRTLMEYVHTMLRVGTQSPGVLLAACRTGSERKA